MKVCLHNFIALDKLTYYSYFLNYLLTNRSVHQLYASLVKKKNTDH